MTTNCDGFEDRVDRVAMSDETMNAEDAAHLESCAVCRARMQRARALEAALADRRVPAASTSFTANVLTAVRRERWRAEQVLDLGFNVAVAAGLLLVFAGIAALAWRSGVLAIGGDIAALVGAGVSILADRAAPQVHNIAIAVVLLTTALGVWWWAEGLEA